MEGGWNEDEKFVKVLVNGLEEFHQEQVEVCTVKIQDI